MNLVDRFWSKVLKGSGCWIWNACRGSHGYGAFLIGRRSFQAHRVAWMLTYGDIPEGLHVLHRCDVKACVNPSHLFIGTHQDNMTDRNRKGRASNKPHPGESHWKAKLTEKDIFLIRQLNASGLPQHVVADKFGIRQGTVSNIVTGKSWKHLL